MRRLNRYRRKIYEYEFGEVLEKPIADQLYGDIISSLSNGILCPVVVVTKVIENYFGFYKYTMLRIHDIITDTQSQTISVDIRLNRPGYIIGKGGKDIDSIKNKLEEIFKRPVDIRLHEIKNDKNIPYTSYRTY
jgi:hypothetical protein